jgi:hypothetical protein
MPQGRNRALRYLRSLKWYRKQCPGYHTRINTLLRGHMHERQKRRARAATLAHAFSLGLRVASYGKKACASCVVLSEACGAGPPA